MYDINIVILTKNFGYNFTGATVATHTLIQKWSGYDEVESIIVLALNVGNYDHVNKLHVVKLKNNGQLRKRAFQLKGKGTIYYSDDHIGYLMKGLPYIHTYHGNWPDAKYISPEMYLKSFYFINRYEETIHNAAVVVNVSQYMKTFTDRFNRRSVVIRNGVAENRKIETKATRGNKVLMIGTLEPRKYGRLPELLKVLPESVHIDSYGNIEDKKLAEELRHYPNFSARGFVNFQEIQLEQYGCFLSLSVMENMPISLVEVLRMGIPVVAYSVGGIPEIVNNDCGVLCSKDTDIREISFALQEIVTGKRTFTMNNRELRKFDWNIAAEKYMNVFQRVLEETGEKQ